MIPQPGANSGINGRRFKRVLHFFDFIYAAALHLMYAAPADVS